MYMIEIASLNNGAHRNQSFNGFLPDGWVIITDDIRTLENFPFGEVEVAEINGIMTLTKWTPGILPEPEPLPEPKPATEDRIADLEEALDLLLSGDTGETSEEVVSE